MIEVVRILEKIPGVIDTGVENLFTPENIHCFSLLMGLPHKM